MAEKRQQERAESKFKKTNKQKNNPQEEEKALSLMEVGKHSRRKGSRQGGRSNVLS